DRRYAPVTYAITVTNRTKVGRGDEAAVEPILAAHSRHCVHQEPNPGRRHRPGRRVSPAPDVFGLAAPRIDIEKTLMETDDGSPRELAVLVLLHQAPARQTMLVSDVLLVVDRHHNVERRLKGNLRGDLAQCRSVAAGEGRLVQEVV